MENYNDRIQKAKDVIKNADYILIGAGAGLSTTAGLEYGGDSFQRDYKEFIEKYHFENLYSASFYEFETQEEKWAFFARMIKLNRFNKEPLKLYQRVFDLVKEKDYFVLTTNVDGQFEKAGFDKNKIFATQGDYSYLQCEQGCHDKLYYNEKLVEKWLSSTKDCKIDSSLVMKCPVCGGNMDMNLRKDIYFVQDEDWYKCNDRYGEFLNKIQGKNTVFIEIGVGFNTPGIIRYPFEKMVYQNPNSTLIRINKDYPSILSEIGIRGISFCEDTNQIIKDLIN